MKRRVFLNLCLLLVLSLLLGACSSFETATHAPILPASARGGAPTDASVPAPTAAVPTAESTNPLEEQAAVALLAFEERFTLTGATTEEGLGAFHAVINDHPEFFWLTGGCTYYDMSNDSGRSVEIVPDLRVPIDQAKSMQQSLESAVSSILSGLKDGMNDFEKALYLHDWLVDNTEYDYATFERVKQDALFQSSAQTAYGCIVEHKAVCAGYSKAYQLLLQRVGIPCRYITGDTSEGLHGWNLITLDGEPYYVDVTWDDPRALDDGSLLVTHEFFCITTAELLETHTPDADQNVPTCTAVKYDYYRYFDLYMETYDRAEYVRRLKNAQGMLQIKFGSPAAAAQAVQDLSDGTIYEFDSSIRSAQYWYKDGGRLVTYEFTRG